MARVTAPKINPTDAPHSPFLLLMTSRGALLVHGKNQPHADLPFCYVSDCPKPHAHAYQPHST